MDSVTVAVSPIGGGNEIRTGTGPVISSKSPRPSTATRKSRQRTGATRSPSTVRPSSDLPPSTGNGADTVNIGTDFFLTDIFQGAVLVELGGGNDTLNLATGGPGPGPNVVFLQTAVFDGQGGTNLLDENTAYVIGSPTVKKF